MPTLRTESRSPSQLYENRALIVMFLARQSVLFLLSLLCLLACLVRVSVDTFPVFPSVLFRKVLGCKKKYDRLADTQF